MQLSNYLFFRDGCEQALSFYTQCGLGRVTTLIRHGDYRPPQHASMRGKIMHSEFSGPGVHFFASDNHDAEPMRGSAHFLQMDSREQLDELFERMSVGANVTTPVSVQPWGYFGKLTDRFGVQWMFNVAM